MIREGIREKMLLLLEIHTNVTSFISLLPDIKLVILQGEKYNIKSIFYGQGQIIIIIIIY